MVLFTISRIRRPVRFSFDIIRRRSIACPDSRKRFLAIFSEAMTGNVDSTVDWIPGFRFA